MDETRTIIRKLVEKNKEILKEKDKKYMLIILNQNLIIKQKLISYKLFSIDTSIKE